MDRNSESTRLARTKLGLAEKYDRLAVEARSAPKKKQFMREAESYRRQATKALRT